MWTHIDKKFSTPPPTLRKQGPPPSPLSERKKLSPMKAKDDLFRVVHKVPAGDSPYGKAKHIQVIVFIYYFFEFIWCNLVGLWLFFVLLYFFFPVIFVILS